MLYRYVRRCRADDCRWIAGAYSVLFMTDAELSRLEWISERAAIREYMGGQTRADAEAGAVADWQATYGAEMPAKGAETRQDESV